VTVDNFRQDDQPGATSGGQTISSGDQKFSYAANGYGAPDVSKPPVEWQGQGLSGIKYQIIGTVLQAVTMEFTHPSQIVYSHSGGMSWMSSGVQMNTNTGGGIGKMFGRMMSGSTAFVVDFHSPGEPGTICFTSDAPGKIIPILLAQGQNIIMQKDAFLAAEKSVELDIFLNQKLGAGFFGGEGFILQKFTGPGLCFAQFDGEIMEYTLQPGQRMLVHPGHVGMFEPTVSFDIQRVKGVTNMLFGGEGIFLSTLTGPGRVWLQTMPMMVLAARIGHYLPHNSGSGGEGFNIKLG